MFFDSKDLFGEYDDRLSSRPARNPVFRCAGLPAGLAAVQALLRRRGQALPRPQELDLGRNYDRPPAEPAHPPVSLSILPPSRWGRQAEPQMFG